MRVIAWLKEFQQKREGYSRYFLKKDVEKGIMLEIGTDKKTLRQNRLSLLHLGMLKREGKYYVFGDELENFT
jgi:tmRNA-binding protein